MGGVMGTDMDAYAAGPNRYIMEVTVWGQHYAKGVYTVVCV
jgi:hypothetical protein